MKRNYIIPCASLVSAVSAQMLALSGNTGGGGTIGGGGNASDGGNPPLDTRRQDAWTTEWEEDW